MVRLLNLHPNILVTHEADIAWILYQLHRDPDAEIKPHPLDEEKGMKATFDMHGSVFKPIREEDSDAHGRVRTAFYRFYDRVNQEGRGQWDLAARKERLAWVGDKKPVQHADPRVWSFLEKTFPQARYLHVIRDPRYVVASMQEAAKKWNDRSVPEHWHRSPASIFGDWIQNEERVARLMEKAPGRIETVRLEDLARNAAQEMGKVFGFLDLCFPDETSETISKMVWKGPNRRHKPVSFGNLGPRERELLEKYRYGG